jgi:hypothetical protein
MKIFSRQLPIALLGFWFYSCSSPVSSQDGKAHLYETETFKNYWYGGKAEVSTYNLVQSRYGESREGKTVLIFVTEDFSQKKQVKLDDPEKAGSDKVSVLKMNFTKNFVTGIYPYSMMLSVFTPISRNQFPNTLKATMSSQEWCGHVFTQLNLKNKKYEAQSNSYFEKEGDENGQLKVTWLEDELWNLIRLDPDNLPIGQVEIIPGLFFSRLLHVGIEAQQATLAKELQAQEVIYTISMPKQNRTLAIHFEKAFPHKILSWEENFMERGKPMQTKAVLDKTLFTDYWTKNKNEFIGLRDSLGLSHKNY